MGVVVEVEHFGVGFGIAVLQGGEFVVAGGGFGEDGGELLKVFVAGEEVEGSQSPGSSLNVFLDDVALEVRLDSDHQPALTVPADAEHHGLLPHAEGVLEVEQHSDSEIGECPPLEPLGSVSGAAEVFEDVR